MFDWEHRIPPQAMMGIGPHLAVRGKSHEFSQVTAGTWGIFSGYSRDGHLKVRLVQ